MTRQSCVLTRRQDGSDEVCERSRKLTDPLLQVGYHLSLVPVEIHSDENQAVNLFAVQRDPVAHTTFFLKLNGPAEG